MTFIVSEIRKVWNKEFRDKLEKRVRYKQPTVEGCALFNFSCSPTLWHFIGEKLPFFGSSGDLAEQICGRFKNLSFEYYNDINCSLV